MWRWRAHWVTWGESLVWVIRSLFVFMLSKILIWKLVKFLRLEAWVWVPLNACLNPKNTWNSHFLPQGIVCYEEIIELHMHTRGSDHGESMQQSHTSVISTAFNIFEHSIGINNYHAFCLLVYISEVWKLLLKVLQTIPATVFYKPNLSLISVL